MDDRRVFVQVVEDGTFTAAAQRLGISTSYASRCVRDLEERLGVPLLARSTRQVTPTDAGRKYHARVAPLLQGLDEADLEICARRVEPQGVLRIAMPQVFGRQWVMPTVLRFQQTWPRVQIDARLSDRDTDPFEVDVTLRGGDLRDSSLVARRLTDFEALLVASPAYLAKHGPLTHPDDLAGQAAVIYSAQRVPGPWTMSRDGQSRVLDVKPVFHADSGEAVVAAAKAGLGLALQPDFLVAPGIGSGDLVRLLPDWQGFQSSFWALTTSRLLPATVRMFLDDLSSDLTDRPWLAGSPRRTGTR